MDSAALLSSMPSSDVVFIESYGLIFPKQLYISGPRSNIAHALRPYWLETNVLKYYQLPVSFHAHKWKKMNVSGSELGENTLFITNILGIKSIVYITLHYLEQFYSKTTQLV